MFHWDLNISELTDLITDILYVDDNIRANSAIYKKLMYGPPTQK